MLLLYLQAVLHIILGQLIACIRWTDCSPTSLLGNVSFLHWRAMALVLLHVAEVLLYTWRLRWHGM